MSTASWPCGGLAWPTARMQTAMKTRPRPTNWSRCVYDRGRAGDRVNVYPSVFVLFVVLG